MRQHRHHIVITLALFALAPGWASAWWSTGHAYLTQSAVQHLPQPLRNFVQSNITYIANRSASEPSGTHYIDIDDYPEWGNGPFPRNKNVLIAAHGAAFVESLGTGPWTAGTLQANLKSQMMTATTLTQWQNTRNNFADLAHYIEDLHQPLHTTGNYNGQRTGNSGIHARYEGEMIERHLVDLPITLQPATYRPSLVDDIFDSIDVTWPYNSPIMAADTLAKTFGSTVSEPYYTSLWNSTGGFTQTQFQFASKMIADAWYSAWVDAGAPTPVPEPSAMLAVLAGLALHGSRRRRR